MVIGGWAMTLVLVKGLDPVDLIPPVDFRDWAIYRFIPVNMNGIIESFKV